MFNREEANRQREIISDECVLLSEENKHLVIELPTGTGKGRICANIIRKSNSAKKWLVVVPEIPQCWNYLKDLEIHDNKDLIETKIEAVICYASLKNYAGGSYSLHLNEAHRVSDARMDILSSIDFDQIISDSATLSPEVMERLNAIHPVKVYKKTLQEVIDLGIIPEPTIECLPVHLDDLDRIYKVKYGKNEQLTHAKGYYDYLCKQIEYWESRYKSERSQFLKNKWMQAALTRKRFLASYKTDVVKEFIGSLGGKRYVCFAGTVDQAKYLGGKAAIHSENAKMINKEIIDDFNSGSTSALFSCMMGVEGMNFFELDCGILVQLDNTERLPLQKTGRMLRSDIPHLFVFYIPNTQDQKYLNKFLQHFDNRYIKNNPNEQEIETPEKKIGISGKKRT